MRKRGISPIIATILLIVLVVIIGAIVFTWFKSMTKEAITKFDGTNIAIVCEDVNFDGSYSNSILTISNTGNVPIYDMEIKIISQGNYETYNLKDYMSTWPESGLNQGMIVSENLNLAGEKIGLIPILLGVDKDNNKKTQSCEERHGKEIFL